MNTDPARHHSHRYSSPAFARSPSQHLETGPDRARTDAHRTRELDLVRLGLDQARKAGLTGDDVLNCLSWDKPGPLMRRR